MLNRPEVVVASSVSAAWIEALALTVHRSRRSLTPLIVVVGTSPSGEVVEDQHLRQMADTVLMENDCYSVSISASMIFPFKSWERAKRPDRLSFFTWYLTEYLPRLKTRAHANQHGTYFERMIAFSGTRNVRGNAAPIVKNQLNDILNDWTRKRAHPRRPRESALQVSCFDPAKDHTGQSVRGFPCLQQVGFAYDDDGGLGVNAYYPTQYVFDRGYGNYLGLCHLGIFMAHELGLRLSQLNCYIGQPLIGSVSKAVARELCKSFGMSEGGATARATGSHLEADR